MELFGSQLLSGIMVGAVYALISLGIVLVYKSTNILNLAQGQILLITAFITFFFLNQLQLNPVLAFLCSFALCALLGYLLERIFMRPMVGQPPWAGIMMTIAFSMILSGVVMLIWGGNIYAYKYFIEPDATLSLGGIKVGLLLTYCAGISLAIFVGFLAFFRYSKTGLLMRSVAEDNQTAQACGISVRRIFSQSWILAAIVAAVGAYAMGSLGQVSFYLEAYGLKMVFVSLLGGLQSIGGCLIAGPIIGVVENMTVSYAEPLLGIGGGLKEVAPYIVGLIVLMVRPFGLFGEPTIRRI